MEINENNMQQLAGYLQNTLAFDPTERRGAEKFLESIESNQNYPVLLLNLIDKQDLALHLRVSASVTFKNYVKRNWPITEESGDKIHTNDRVVIKQIIISLMLASPEQIQRQLSDAISCIGRQDFPDKWPDLMTEMIGKFQAGDFRIINGVLHTAHSIFKRYRHEFKSEKLWIEIKFVLDKFAQPFTQLSNQMMELAQQHASNRENLNVIYNSLVVICKIFYSLNFQDLPEFFEDNMAIWMSHFHALLTIDNKLLETDDKDEPGLMEQVKSQVCDNLTMYAQKYDEEFSPHLPAFVTDIWHLLVNAGTKVKYDLLVSNAIQFLATVAERVNYKQLFEDPATLSSICEKVIVPNMEFREADEEAFGDNAEEYIRRDIEGSDIDTRRRAACDLVRALSRSFETTVIQNFSVYVQQMLQIYQEDPRKNWKSKDAAIFLVTSLAAKAQTQKHGITQTSQLIDVPQFFSNHIAIDLQSPDVNANPVIKADAIKYVMVFRNQLSREILLSCLPCLINLLSSNSQVVHSYSACCLDKLLAMKPAIITKADLIQYCEALLSNLFMALNSPGSQENEYIMKAIMRSLNILKETVAPFYQTIFTQLMQKLAIVCKNPCKPHFNHFLFESLGLLISLTCKANNQLPQVIEAFEAQLFPLFQEILQQDVQEFIPYIFQILSLMLELHKDRAPEPYMLLFPHLLQPLLWERHGNIPALVRLMEAFICIGLKDDQIPADKLPSILGIFQKLLASKTNDHLSFHLLNSLVLNAKRDVLQQYLQQIFILLFQKLTTSKTPRFVKCILVFFSLYILKYGTANFMQLLDNIQNRMFSMVVEKIFIAECDKLVLPNERKICAVAMIKILFEPGLIGDENYTQLWLPLLQSLITFLEQPAPASMISQTDDFKVAEINSLESEGFQAAYSQLIFSSKSEIDFCPECPDAKQELIKSLGQAFSTTPNIKAKVMESHMEAKQRIFQYLQANGITIS